MVIWVVEFHGRDTQLIGIGCYYLLQGNIQGKIERETDKCIYNQREKLLVQFDTFVYLFLLQQLSNE